MEKNINKIIIISLGFILFFAGSNIFPSLNLKAEASTIQSTTNSVIVENQSPIILKIENLYQSVDVGDTIDYTVYYRNIGKNKLTRSILQIVVPKGTVITKASSGTYSKDSNVLSVELGDLVNGSEGNVSFQGKVESITTGPAQIVTTAVIIYTNSIGTQENAIAYVLNNPKSNIVNPNTTIVFKGSSQTAQASSVWTMNIGLVGLLLIILFILILILLMRSFYQKKVVTTHLANPQTPGSTTSTIHYY